MTPELVCLNTWSQAGSAIWEIVACLGLTHGRRGPEVQLFRDSGPSVPSPSSQLPVGLHEEQCGSPTGHDFLTLEQWARISLASLKFPHPTPRCFFTVRTMTRAHLLHFVAFWANFLMSWIVLAPCGYFNLSVEPPQPVPCWAHAGGIVLDSSPIFLWFTVTPHTTVQVLLESNNGSSLIFFAFFRFV